MVTNTVAANNGQQPNPARTFRKVLPQQAPLSMSSLCNSSRRECGLPRSWTFSIRSFNPVDRSITKPAAISTLTTATGTLGTFVLRTTDHCFVRAVVNTLIVRWMFQGATRQPMDRVPRLLWFAVFVFTVGNVIALVSWARTPSMYWAVQTIIATPFSRIRLVSHLAGPTQAIWNERLTVFGGGGSGSTLIVADSSVVNGYANKAVWGGPLH